MCSECRCAWRVSDVVGGCNVVAVLSMADMVCLGCRKCGVHEQWWVLYGMLECKLRCEILLLLDIADMDRLLCERLWSEH